MRTHSGKSRRRKLGLIGPALLCLGALAFGACSDSTGPGDEFDPVTTQRAAEDVFLAVSDNPAVQSVAVLSEGFPSFAAGPVAAAAELPLDTPTPDEAEHWLLRRLRQLDQPPAFYSPAEPAVLFPADLLGKTLVYNDQTGMYEVDDTRTGAPTAGVRFILYAVDPVLHQPVIPLNEIGHLDLEDKSSPSVDMLGITAVVSGTTVLDYDASATVTTSSVTLSAAGYVSNGTTQVDFDLSLSLSETTGITVDYDVSVPSENAGVSLLLTADLQAQSISVTLTITYDGNTVVFDVTGTQTTITGSVTYNGDTVIEISGNPDAPTFTDVSGTPLTQAQLQALGAIFEAAGEVLDAFDDLLAPAFKVLQISIFFDL
ncbi:MAG: hypothetical protein GTN62_07170 [Gemmatimonadales bacterium]|nr:hypothetical protein [Gemmatimonadales bacterium]NIN11280.1 hypothetical protein [Gemmatimonadales bacterium]NIN49879.1 hypothetical protein [Gemmatimonadales bacterium]NIP07343.1 hypothetical protein [Gemmatimonadales bacterium]NIR03038.1 hypothetical protein [Gemmatimonadales bacterium]